MKLKIRSDIKGRFVRFNRMILRPPSNGTSMVVGQTVKASMAGDNGALLRTEGGRFEVWIEGEQATVGTRYTKQNRPPNGGFVGQQTRKP